MSAHELRQRMHDNVASEINRPAQIRRSERVIDNQRDVVLMRDLRHRFNIEHISARVADRLAVQKLCLRRDRAAEVLRIVGINKGDVVAEPAEGHVELRVGSAVERARRHHVIAVLHQATDGDELSRLPARHGERRRAVLE
jgi:hypothetical protein